MFENSVLRFVKMVGVVGCMSRHGRHKWCITEEKGFRCII